MASAFLAFAAVSAAGAASAPTPRYEFVYVGETAEVKGAVERPAGKAAPLAAQGPAAQAAFAKLGQSYAGEVEPNGAFASASPLTGTNLVVRANLFPNGDTDFYSFTATAGDRVYLATMTAFSAGNSTDSQLTLLASDGTTTIEFDDDNGSFAGLSSSIAGATIPTTGTYFIRVNDFTAGTTSERGYELHFRLQSGAPTPEVEANDTPATANPLPANGWISGTRNPAAATEQDWFSLNLNAGDTVYLALDVNPERDAVVWNGRLGFALFGDAANQILVVDDAGTGDVSPVPNNPSEAMFFTVKTAGTYFAFVDSASAAVGGPTATYHLSVSVHPASNEGVNCTTYTSTDVPKTIGPGTGLVSSVITIPGNPRIADLDVDLVLNHALMQDVDVQLRSPAGNDNMLFADIGAAATGGQTQMDVVFDDEAGIPPSFTAFRGTQLKPENNSTAGTASTSGATRLSWFDGENAGGTWTLDIRDDTTGANGGTLTSWGLRVCEMPPPPACPPGFGPQTVYSTDFESGAGGFTHAGAADEWELGLPATVATTTANPIAPFNTCNSGVNCWKTDLDNTYDASSNQDLLSPNIDLAGLSAPVVVTWAQRHQVETANFDHMFIDFQEVGGANPVRLYEWLDPTPISASAGTGNPQANIGGSAGWGVHSRRADSLAGLNTELRFHLDSDTTVQFGGLAIDDVSVTACRALSADLSITKTDGITTATPGGSATYTITASNAGPDPVTGAAVADTFPAILTCNWTCVGAGGGTCTAAGAGNINDAVNLPAGGSVTYTASCGINASATGSLSNTATVGSAIADPNPGNNSATDTDTLTPQADLSITKTDGVTTAVPGGSVTYTITASNAGLSNAPGATVADTFPAALTCTWTCIGAGGGTCTAAGSGNINDVVNLSAGGSVTYTASCAVAASATGILSNTATVAAPAGVTDPTPGNDFATDDDTLTPQADLAITKTDGVTSAVPGGSTTYTITASNAGPSHAPGTIVADTFPASLTCSSSCVGAGGGTCTAGPFAGNINDTANLPAGASVTYTSVCSISGTATGTLANTATAEATGDVSDANPGNNSATDTDTLDPQADLSITKTDGVDAFVPGGSLTYTIVASNAGASAVTGATVTDTFPAALTCDWSCVGAGGGTCTAGPASGNIGDTVNLPAGGSATYTAVCDVASDASGTIANTATIEVPGGVTDPTPGNNSVTDTDSIDPQADLSITKTDGATTATPGGTLTYTIVAANAGPSGITGATVADTLPADLTCTWTCSGTGGGNCTTGAGAGNINDTVNLPVSATVTYVTVCDVAADAAAPIVNTATITAPAGATEIDTSNNSATDTDTIAATPEADLSITKTDGVASTEAGDTLTYSIVAANAGPDTATGAVVSDTFPADLTCTWSCAGSGGATCTAGGSGNIADNANLPSGGSVTYTATCVVSDTASGSIVNTATVEAPAGTTDPVPGNNSATDTDTVVDTADLSITKTDGATTVNPGQSLTYVIVASNSGPQTATGASVDDSFPAECSSVTWTCSGSGGGICTANGSGDIADTVNLPASASVTYTAVCVVDAATADATVVSNTATVALAGGTPDPLPGNDSATDTTTVFGAPDVSGTKTVSGDFAPGDTITYSIVLSNDGNAAQPDNPGDEFSDTLPAGLTHVSSSATSGTTTFAGGAVHWNGTLAVDASVTITIQATIDDDASGVINNQGTVNYDADNNGSNEASDPTDDPDEAGDSNPTGFTVEGGTVLPTPIPAVIPTTGTLPLIALVLLMLGFAFRRRGV